MNHGSEIRREVQREKISSASKASGDWSLYLGIPEQEYAIDLAPATRIDEQPRVPPTELMEYGESGDRHLVSGRENVDSMLSALGQCGFDWDRCHRVLEFGCSNGKMIRWLADKAEDREIWGVDIQADKIRWAMENLHPPLHFATTTTVPHLPFRDDSFDLIFAGSVFTHIGELHLAWLLELARILSPRGFLYITLHDEMAVQVAFTSSGRYVRRAQQMKSSRFAEALSSGNFGFVSMAPYRGGMLSHVQMSSAYVRRITTPFLRLVDTFPCAYAGLQTGYVFVPENSRVLGQPR
jgi:ubiquinone/menaquinone biosynthesis C-methylase UbiE